MALEPADNRTALVRQTVEGLLTLHDPKVAAQMIADIVTRYAPSLASWAGEGICRRLMDCPERRAALAKLGNALPDKPGLFDHIRVVEPPAEGVEPTVLVDTELMRILVALGYGIQTLVYAVARQMTAGRDGSGRVRIADLVSQLKALGAAATARTIQRHWLAKGEGILWRISGEWLYLTGYQKLCVRAVEMAVEAGRVELVTTNPPGSKFIAVPMTSPPDSNPSPTPMTSPPDPLSMYGEGERQTPPLTPNPSPTQAGRGEKPRNSMRQEGDSPTAARMGSVRLTPKLWYGKLLAAWHNSRADHTTVISRFTLCTLWDVSKKTLIGWEKAAGIEAGKCYAVYTDEACIPYKHAFPILVSEETADGGTTAVVRAMARHSNLYHAPRMSERQHRRVPREARRAARRALEELTQDGTPNGMCGRPAAASSSRTQLSAGVGFGPTGRRNFYANDGNLSRAFKRLQAHLKRHDEDRKADGSPAAHYVALGYRKRQKHWLFEQSSDGYQQTGMNSRVPRKIENFYFAAQGGRCVYTAAWRSFAEI
jgi:hypothetical protein